MAVLTAVTIGARAGSACAQTNGLKRVGVVYQGGHYEPSIAGLRDGLSAAGLTVYGGRNAPYLWIRTPRGLSSWDFFDRLLAEAHVLGAPGSGFGPAGEGYYRLTAFGSRADAEEAVARVRKLAL